MISEFDQTITLVEQINFLIFEHLKNTQQEDIKNWNLQHKGKSSIKAKKVFLAQMKQQHVDVLKFSLEKLAVKIQDDVEKDKSLKPKF